MAGDPALICTKTGLAAGEPAARPLLAPLSGTAAPLPPAGLRDLLPLPSLLVSPLPLPPVLPLPHALPPPLPLPPLLPLPLPPPLLLPPLDSRGRGSGLWPPPRAPRGADASCSASRSAAPAGAAASAAAGAALPPCAAGDCLRCCAAGSCWCCTGGVPAFGGCAATSGARWLPTAAPSAAQVKDRFHVSSLGTSRSQVMFGNLLHAPKGHASILDVAGGATPQQIASPQSKLVQEEPT